MELHKKKRLVIVIETVALERLLRRFDELDAPGYTVMPAMAGRGRSGSWRRDGMMTDTGVMSVVTLILDESRLEPVLEAAFAVVQRQIGIVTVTDVEVVRAEYF